MEFVGENIKNSILKQLRNSEEEILLMLAWFTDTEILVTLEQILNSKQIPIKILLSNSPWNLICQDKFTELSQRFANVEFRTYGSVAPVGNDILPFLHSKLGIIDKKIVLNGSYNWTKNASNNIEDYTIICNSEEGEKARNKFFNFWEISMGISENIKFTVDFVDEIINFEDSGMPPEEWHSKNNFSVLNDNSMEEKKEQGLIVTNPLWKNVKEEEMNQFICNEDIGLWTIENTIGHLIKLGIKKDDKIFDIYIDSISFKKSILDNRDFYLAYQRIGKIGVYFLNYYANHILLKAPFRITRYNNSEHTYLIEGNINLEIKKFFRNGEDKLQRALDYIQFYGAKESSYNLALDIDSMGFL